MGPDLLRPILQGVITTRVDELLKAVVRNRVHVQEIRFDMNVVLGTARFGTERLGNRDRAGGYGVFRSRDAVRDSMGLGLGEADWLALPGIPELERALEQTAAKCELRMGESPAAAVRASNSSFARRGWPAMLSSTKPTHPPRELTSSTTSPTERGGKDSAFF